MKKLVYLIALIIIITGLFFFIKHTSQPTKNTLTNTKVTVQLKWINQAQFSGYYFAKESGMYQNAGLDVDLIPGGPDISPIQSVVTGASQFGVIGGDQILLAREKGVPVVAIAVIYKKTPVALVSLKKSNILKPSDLEGKTVAMVYGKDEEVMYRAMLDKAEVKRSSIKEVPLTFDLSQITTGKVAAQVVYEMNEPVLLKQKGFEINLMKPRDYGVNLYSDTLFTTEEMIRDHPDVVRKFVQATIQGWKDSFTDPKTAIDYVLKTNSSLNRDQQTQFLELSKPLIAGDGNIGVSAQSDWENMQKTLIKYQDMKNKINLTRAFTNEFIN